VLKVIMCLKESVASEELDQNAANAPNIAGEAPAEVEYDFWSTIVAGRDDGRVIFVIERGGTEID
jgi:hypothetical protein